MDRLSALIAVVALTGACESKKEGSAEPPSRTNAAKVTKKAVSTEAFCDKLFKGDEGPKMTVPEVVSKEAIVPAAGGWHWFNVWATWCKPCIEEMPRLLAWRDKLRGAGKKIEVSFISVDESDDEIAAFRKANPKAPASARLAATKDQETWFPKLGLDGSPPIPVHVFVAPSGHIRCVRAGSVNEPDYAAVEALLAE